MKTTFQFTLAAVTAVVAAASATPALANLALAQKNACMACHAVDKKVLGPAYQEVAKKYGAHKDGAAQMAIGIRQGGSGKWGAAPMPAQPNLSEADAKLLAEWILAGAK